jgi:DHA3 family tetracycline resistance protein-like MFS transporter
MIGRVSSLDWILSLGLVPVSYALTGPVATAIGAQATLLWAGLVGCTVLLLVLLLVPDVRSLAAEDEQPEATAAAA